MPKLMLSRNRFSKYDADVRMTSSWYQNDVIKIIIENHGKTLINKANRVLVQHSDDAEFCPGFQSCEYNIKFQQSHSDVSILMKRIIRKKE